MNLVASNQKIAKLNACLASSKQSQGLYERRAIAATLLQDYKVIPKFRTMCNIKLESWYNKKCVVSFQATSYDSFLKQLAEHIKNKPAFYFSQESAKIMIVCSFEEGTNVTRHLWEDCLILVNGEVITNTNKSANKSNISIRSATTEKVIKQSTSSLAVAGKKPLKIVLHKTHADNQDTSKDTSKDVKGTLSTRVASIVFGDIKRIESTIKSWKGKMKESEHKELEQYQRNIARFILKEYMSKLPKEYQEKIKKI